MIVNKKPNPSYKILAKIDKIALKPPYKGSIILTKIVLKIPYKGLIWKL